ncbi:MAG: hypothetical protein ACRCWS_07785, partial [Propionibacteriaceae bacterium]
ILVVDWKTSHQESADPLQLAIYTAAIADIFAISPCQVDAAFYYVRTDHLVVVSDLPDRTALAEVLDSLSA